MLSRLEMITQAADGWSGWAPLLWHSSPLFAPQRLGQTQWRSTLTSLRARNPASPPVPQRAGQGHHCLARAQLNWAQTTFRIATQVLFRPLRKATGQFQHSLVNLFQHFMQTFLSVPMYTTCESKEERLAPSIFPMKQKENPEVSSTWVSYKL